MGRARRDRTALSEKGGWGSCVCGNYKEVKRSGACAAGQAEQDGQLQSVVSSWRYQISWKRRDEDRYPPSSLPL